MADFFSMIHGSLPVKIIGIGIIIWSFYVILKNPDVPLFDALMNKKKEEWDKAQKAAQEEAAKESKSGTETDSAE